MLGVFPAILFLNGAGEFIEVIGAVFSHGEPPDILWLAGAGHTLRDA